MFRRKLTKKIIIFVIVGMLLIGSLVYAYIRYTNQNKLNQYPMGYPYSCTGKTETLHPQCPTWTEDEGKVIVAHRSEVKELVQQYGRRGVVIRALEFKDVQDKAFLMRLLGQNYIELGCIIEVAYPGGRYIYLDNDKLDVISRLDGVQFDKWIQSAPPEDIKKYTEHLH